MKVLSKLHQRFVLAALGLMTIVGCQSQAAEPAPQQQVSAPASEKPVKPAAPVLPKSIVLPKISMEAIRPAAEKDIAAARSVASVKPELAPLAEKYAAKTEQALAQVSELEARIEGVRQPLANGDFAAAATMLTPELVQQGKDAIQALKDAQAAHEELETQAEPTTTEGGTIEENPNPTVETPTPEGTQAEEKKGKEWYEVLLDILLFILRVIELIVRLFGSGDGGSGGGSGGGVGTGTSTGTGDFPDSTGEDGGLMADGDVGYAAAAIGGEGGQHLVTYKTDPNHDPEVVLALNGDGNALRHLSLGFSEPHPLTAAFRSGQGRVKSLLSHQGEAISLRLTANDEVFDVRWADQKSGPVIINGSGN